MIGQAMIYLAGPIDSDPKAGPWRSQAAAHLAEHGIATFNPLLAFAGATCAPQYVDEINRYALATCTAVLVNLLTDGRAFGTIREIEQAAHLEKPMIVVAGEWIINHVSAYDLAIEGRLEAALDLLVKQYAPR